MPVVRALPGAQTPLQQHPVEPLMAAGDSLSVGIAFLCSVTDFYLFSQKPVANPSSSVQR